MFNKETGYASPAVEIVYISSADIITESTKDNEVDFGNIGNS